ncbi:unnamed protein product [Arabidopsis arenosa]|uniref:Pentatricopeptide repeat-containing protein-mitochondrial domain-containing protein n=1 Tax=Arabidopsis arenosa TaxID=38785 RepID=A0A8S2AID1_ARAAE|nr:unnamed protein product [Arabidopsis arenosa]
MAFSRIALLCQRFSRQQQQRQLHRPFTTKLDNTRFLYPNQSKLAQNLIAIFTRQPFSPEDPELLKLAPELNTKVVETVLNGFKRWGLAYLFFNWASKQEGYRNDMYAYNAMASILSRVRQNASLTALVGDVLNSRCLMSPGALGFFIRCLGNAGLVEEASSVFDRVREMGLCVPNAYTYNCLLEAISKSNSSSVELVEARLKEMRDCGFHFDKFTLTPVLQVYCNNGKSERALSVFNEILSRDWLDEHISTILVVSFCKWGQVDKAFELIEMLEERHIRLNYKTYCVLIHGFVKESRIDKAFQLFEKMRRMGMNADIALYDVLIGGLCKHKDLEMALSLYLEIKRSGIPPDRGILGKLICSFSEESELSRITKVIIGDIDTKCVMLLYKSLLEGFSRNDLVHEAYSFIRSLMGNHESDGVSEIVKLLKDQNKAILPDSDSLSIVIDCLVKANKVDMAMTLLHDIVQNGLIPSLMMYNNIIEGMCKEGRSEESLKLLGEMKDAGVEPSQFTLNCIYGCLAERCDFAGALDLLKKMRFYGFEPWIKHTTFLVKKLCENGKAVDACKYIDDVAGEGFLRHMVAYTAAIDGLIKNEGVDRGLELFRDTCANGHCPDVIAYHVLIKALCKAYRTTEADNLFNEMVSKGLKPSVATYNSMIDGWCKEGEIDRGLSCIVRMYEDEKNPDVITYTSLIHGLCASGRPSEAISRWNEMKGKDCYPNRITFMALIQGLCNCGWSSEALVYFREMEEKEMEPDSAVYLSLVSSFLSSENISAGFGIFREMVHKGRFPVSVDRNYLLAVDATSDVNYAYKFLSKLSNPPDYGWNFVIRGFSNSKNPEKSIRVYIQILRSGFSPDHMTYPFLLKSSSRLSNRKLDAYAKCGDVVSARLVFDEMTTRDVVSWSSMIDGYVKSGEYNEALEIFDQMMRMGSSKANEVTMVSVLCACAHLGALNQGKTVHRYILDVHLPLTVILQTSLIDMYAKCGSIGDAWGVFCGASVKETDALMWNAMIGGLASHGFIRESLQLFHKMKESKIDPDEITFLCLLAACSHGGLVKEAWHFFTSLKESGAEPKSEHYACMVDVLSRAGLVKDAHDFISEMPIKPTGSILGALQNGCINHGNLELAETVGKKLIELQPHNDGRYVGLANVYAINKQFGAARSMREAMEKKGVKKIAGHSIIDLNGTSHRFIAHDKSHFHSDKIYAVLQLIGTWMNLDVDEDDHCFCS